MTLCLSLNVIHQIIFCIKTLLNHGKYLDHKKSIKKKKMKNNMFQYMYFYELIKKILNKKSEF
jgi:hypothetical protein